MQLEQVNALLLDKISMQSEGLGQRERMLERERDFVDLKASFAGKDLPEEVKTRLLGLHEENIQLKEQIKTTQDKLNRAKQFIKDQDKLFREEHGKSTIASEVRSNVSSSNGHTDDVPKSGAFDENEETLRSQIKILEEEVSRFKVSISHHQNVEEVQDQLFTSSDSKPTPNDDTSGNKRSCLVTYMLLASSYSDLQARRRQRYTMDPRVGWASNAKGLVEYLSTTFAPS